MADHIILMRDGRIEQEGKPNDLYDHPCTLFVAGFLGTPRINTFRCRVTDQEGVQMLDADVFKLAVPADMTACLAPYAGKEVVLGVRPSDLVPEENGVIIGTVDGVEPLGDANLVYVKAGEQVLIFKTAPENNTFPQTVRLNPNSARLHLFDPETEKRINA